MSSDEQGKTYMQEIFERLDDFYLNHAASEGFRSFFLKHKDVKKWMIASDYCLGDKDKPNNTMGISIIPYLTHFPEMKKEVKEKAPKDIKNSRHVKDEFIQYLSSGNAFHLCFILTDFSALGETKEEVEAIADQLIKLHERWIVSTPEAKDKHLKILKKLKHLKQETKNKGFNLTLFHNMYFLAFMVAYFYHYINKATHADTIGWFSDRDAMLNAYKKVAVDLLSMHFHTISELTGNNSSDISIAIGVPELEGSMWYDEIVRLPDYIAGAFADWNLDTNWCSKDKFLPIIEEIGTTPESFHLAKIGLHKGLFEHKIINISKLCAEETPSD